MQQMTLGLMIAFTHSYVLAMLSSQSVSTHSVPSGNILECVKIPLPTHTHTHDYDNIPWALRRESEWNFSHGAERWPWTLAGKVLTVMISTRSKDSKCVR